MNSFELDKILRRNPVTRRIYCGVHPSDRIPLIKKFPCAMIINFDEAEKPGTHWVALYAPSKFHVKYFDSLGSAARGGYGPGISVKNISDYINNHFLFVSRAVRNSGN